MPVTARAGRIRRRVLDAHLNVFHYTNPGYCRDHHAVCQACDHVSQGFLKIHTTWRRGLPKYRLGIAFQYDCRDPATRSVRRLPQRKAQPGVRIRVSASRDCFPRFTQTLLGGGSALRVPGRPRGAPQLLRTRISGAAHHECASVRHVSCHTQAIPNDSRIFVLTLTRSNSRVRAATGFESDSSACDARAPVAALKRSATTARYASLRSFLRRCHDAGANEFPPAALAIEATPGQ